MTTQEFSNAFDTLLNSYNSKANFGEGAARTDIVLDEYEKSVFLTQAQDIIIKSYFSSATNPQGEGIDDSTRRQVDFSGLITVATENLNKSNHDAIKCFDPRGLLCSLPDDVLIILNERLEVSKSITPEGGGTAKTIKKSYVVVPINYTEYDRLMSRAYAQPLKKQCWRLFQGNNSSAKTIQSEIIPIEGIVENSATYYVRYIKRPTPIILTDLNFENQESLDIDGKSEVSECKLNPIIHMDILNKAFELAIVAKTRALPMDKE